MFWTDSVVLCYSNVEAAKQWWIGALECAQTKVPTDWEYRLPSDVALKLPGDDDPTILLCSQAEVRQAGFERPNGRPILFCTQLDKAYRYLDERRAVPGPIQDGGDTQFFEIR